MTAGDLRDRVTFYEPTATTDSLRGQAVAYTVVRCTVPVNWRGLTSREMLVAQAMDVLPQYRITMRFRDDITTKLRVQRHVGDYGQHTTMCQVVGVTDSAGTRQWLEVDLVEVL
jgi:SPP1 family predicted phage head-tail adaptor